MFWGLATLLLIALWKRSYYWFDVARIDPIFKAYSIGGQFGAGCLVLDGINSFTPAFPQTTFRYQCSSMEKFRAALQQKQGDTPLPSRVWGGLSARIEGRNYFSICIPHWFLVLTAASLVAFPWLPWWSPRFSLRTLLVATTLVAVVLESVVYAARN